MKNDSRGAIYLDDTSGTLGLQVQRSVAGSWDGFVEVPACACQACDDGCSADSCVCPDPDQHVRRLLAGDTAERQWSGIVQLSNTLACGFTQTQSCLQPENAPYNETFQLHLCYNLAAKNISFDADGGDGSGALSSDQTCVDKEFRIDDGTVEIGPVKGADCMTTADCKGTDELCFSGSCTASCPDNDYPTLGSNWALRIASPDDEGFFTSTVDGGVTVFTGTGSVSSAIYQGSTVTIRLTRTESGAALNGALYVTLPPGELGPLTMGQEVAVKLVDGSTDDNPENRALVIRDPQGVLLLAADMTQEGRLLTDADTAPFKVSFDTALTGCTFTGCGRQLYTATRFTGYGMSTLLESGKSAEVVGTDGTYEELDVSSSTATKGACQLNDLRPWAIWREKAAGGGP